VHKAPLILCAIFANSLRCFGRLTMLYYGLYTVRMGANCRMVQNVHKASGKKCKIDKFSANLAKFADSARLLQHIGFCAKLYTENCRLPLATV